MAGGYKQLALWAVAVLAIAAGGLTPWQTASAWQLGTPIVTYWGGPNLTHAVAQHAVAGGYNTVWCWSPDEASVADQYGLRAQLVIDNIYAHLTTEWLDDPGKKAQLDAKIAAFRTHPSAYSYYVYDEPNAGQFTDLNRIVSYLRDADPQRLGYINLYPTYASAAQLGTTGSTVSDRYNTYLDQYVSTVQPSLLSYDHYQLLSTGEDYREYLLNLGLTSTKTHQAGVPFMQIVQASTWEDPDYRVPSSNELRFLIYSTLAYGAQGISYFTYQPSNNGGAGGLVGADGTTTSIYAALTPLNHEFAKIAQEFASLRWIETYLKGYYSYARPPGTTLLPDDAPFSVSGVSDTRWYHDGDPLKGVLLGLFDTDGTALGDATFALVENLDYSANKTVTVTGPGNLSIFDATTGTWTAMGSDQIELDLLPGGGVLVGLTLLVPEPGEFTLLVIGLIGLLAYAWRKRRRCMIQESSRC